MFGHNMNAIPYDYSYEFQAQFPLQDSTTHTSHPPPPLFLPPLSIPDKEHDSLSALRSEIGYTSSGCSSYGGSPASITSYSTYSPSLIPRSMSSHSFQKNLEAYSPMHSSPPGYLGYEKSSVRKALSTSDLQGVNLAQHRERLNSPLTIESSIIESMSRASPYTPEEKKERIERYRSKRNLRNFTKKIKYECRKTLADSRPRIRGRFTRNDEIEKISQSQWDQRGIEEDDDENIDDSWINFLDAFSANLIP